MFYNFQVKIKLHAAESQVKITINYDLCCYGLEDLKYIIDIRLT